jgi:hypothetical protein
MCLTVGLQSQDSWLSKVRPLLVVGKHQWGGSENPSSDVWAAPMRIWTAHEYLKRLGALVSAVEVVSLDRIVSRFSVAIYLPSSTSFY